MIYVKMKLTKIVFFMSLIILTQGLAQAQNQAETLYREGNFAQAAKEFESLTKSDKNNARWWNFLALSYEKTGRIKDARKAAKKATNIAPMISDYHQNLAAILLRLKKWKDANRSAGKAINLSPESSVSYYFRSVANYRSNNPKPALADIEKAIELDPKISQYYIQKSNLILKDSLFESKLSSNNVLSDSIAVLKKCKQTCNGNLTDIDNMLLIQNYVLSRLEGKQNPVRLTSELPKNCTQLKILSKPRPSYTDSARSNGVTGNVRMVVLFGNDGEIKQIFVIKGLPNGLSEQAVKAVRKVSFQPESCDGKPRSAAKILVYNFSIY